MIVVLSVMDGFEAELRKRLMSSDLHVLITPTPKVAEFDAGFVPKEALDTGIVQDAVRRKGQVVELWSVVSTEAILKTGRKVTGIVLKGISDERLKRLKSQVTEAAEPSLLVQREGTGSIRLPGLYVGQELAFEMGLIPGDQVTLISPTETEGPLEGVPRLKRYVVEGVYHSGLPEQELHTVFAQESAVHSFLRRSEVVTHWEMSLKDFDRANEVRQELEGRIPQFRVQDWMQLNGQLFASLRLERAAMFIGLAFIVIVASFNIVTTLTLMVLEKRREISILKAFGARHGQVAAIFLAEGLLIGASGVALGTGGGLLLCTILKRYEFITLPEVYYDRTLPVTFNPTYYVAVSLCALVIVLVSCLAPSRRAARLNPLDGIRFG